MSSHSNQGVNSTFIITLAGVQDSVTVSQLCDPPAQSRDSRSIAFAHPQSSQGAAVSFVSDVTDSREDIDVRRSGVSWTIQSALEKAQSADWEASQKAVEVVIDPNMTV